jgi:hypothetical protein
VKGHGVWADTLVWRASGWRTAPFRETRRTEKKNNIPLKMEKFAKEQSEGKKA